MLVLAVFGVNFINVFLNLIFEVKLYYPFSDFAGYLVYFLAGYYFKNFEISKKVEIWLYILAIISLFITTYFTYYFSDSIKNIEYLYDYNLLNTALITFAIFLLFRNIFKDRVYQNTLLKSVANLSFGVYLIHALVLSVFIRIGISTTLINPLFMVPILACLVFLISLAISFIISKIPFVKKII